MGIQSANVWHFGLRLTNTAFKPALGELYKTHPICTKIPLFEIHNFFFWRGDIAYPPQTPPPVGRGTVHPLSKPHSLGASSPHLLILELTLFGSHTPCWKIKLQGHEVNTSHKNS